MTRFSKGAAALVMLAVPLGASVNARAQTPATGVSLAWNAPAGCSDRDAILHEVDRLRGGATPVQKLDATATVSLGDGGVWNLQITTIFADGTRGERTLQAESCKAAADATASILALALTDEEKAAAATSASPSASVAPSPSPNPNPNPNPNPALAPSLYAGGALGFTSGDLPSVGLGGGGFAGVGLGVLRAELFADYWAFGRARFRTPGGADFQLFDAGARTCLSFGDTFSVGPCAALELGSMRGASFDVTRPSSGSALTGEALLGGLGTFSLDKNRHFRLRALLELGAVFDRPQFVLDGVGFVHQPSPVVGRGTVGAEVHF